MLGIKTKDQRGDEEAEDNGVARLARFLYKLEEKMAKLALEELLVLRILKRSVLHG